MGAIVKDVLHSTTFSLFIKDSPVRSVFLVQAYACGSGCQQVAAGSAAISHTP